VYKAVRRSVLIEAKAMAEDAKRRASWSTRIPGTVKASAQGMNTAVVKAGGASAPHAAAFEHAGKEGPFRHPVHGHDVWVSQDAHPFLHPAAIARLDTTVEALGTAVSTAVSDAIGHG
jgi:hypothetical protein